MSIIKQSLGSPSSIIKPPAPMQPLEDDKRDIDDIPGTRRAIYDRALLAAQGVQPLSNGRHTLSLSNVDYIDPDHISQAAQKKAILEGSTLGRRMRGTWTLADLEGNILDKKRSVLGSVPYLTNRGTYVHNGNEYTMSNQMRLRPGIYARKKDNGEVEAHVNIMPGKGGRAHRYFMDPDKGVFFMRVGQAKVPMMPLLRAMGATDDDLRKSWGKEIFASNYQHDDPGSLQKLHKRLLGDKADEKLEAKSKRQEIAEYFEKMEVDPEVMQRTLGIKDGKLNKASLLRATQKLLNISKGEEDVDDRDALAFQTAHGPEDLFAERIERDAGRARQQAFWKASFKGNLKSFPTGLLGRQLEAALLHSGMGQSIEEINPAEIHDKVTRLSRMGEGGIPSLDAVPDEARNVQPSHAGFVDPLRTPESLRAGVDLYMAGRVRKGKDGRLYAPFKDKKGEIVYKSPQETADMTLAFPGQQKSESKRIVALKDGQLKYVDRKEVDLEIPHFENAFSTLGSMVPLKSAVKGQRVAMASRMFTQALPLTNGEAPLVQSGIPDKEGMSYEDMMGAKMGAVRAKGPGSVRNITPDGIEVVYDDGTTETHETYNNFPFNRKTYLHNTPTVQIGQRVDADSLLARSNFTDANGTTALGVNARVAYLPFKGLNFEDAAVISEGMAKRLSSEHMYQHSLEATDDHKMGRKSYVSLFPGKYDKKALEKIDDDGVVTPGTTVEYGAPLILGAKRKEKAHNKVHRKRDPGFADASLTWDHHQPGVVTDVVKTKKGPVVLVKAQMPMQVGDKLSGRYGDKGVISRIVPDDQMPHNKDGTPYEVLLNPLGIISRTNPAQMVEAALGKIAEKTGQPIKIKDFEDISDLTEYAIDQLKKHDLEDMEDVFDPETERKLREKVFAGNRFFMKLHHTAEGKGQGRGTGGYTLDDSPAKGGESGSKRIAMLDTNALLSHGATQVLRDAGAVRGQRNEDYWLQFMQGNTPREPDVPHQYQKFVNQLKASGINVVEKGGQMNIMALTDGDIDEMAGNRVIESGQTVNWKQGLKPIKGGLFDESLTGGHNGKRWSAIQLAEPMPNPVMEEPIRRVLGLTGPQFQDVISGKQSIAEHTGPQAITRALSKINLDKELIVTRAQAKSSSKTARDTANRKLQYLKSAKTLGIHPKDWILHKAPVLPPAFRPVSVMSDNKLPLVSDANYLYQELLDSNDNLASMKKELGDDVGDERLALYNSFKAVTGLGDPTQTKLQEKNVTGILKGIFGSSPKFGTVQRKLISNTVDNVGRAVITPNPDLDMDEVGLPEDKAWDVYQNFVVRRLKRKGLPLVRALREVKERTARAKDELQSEMRQRPVIINRAPVLHRYGILAFHPRLTKNDTLQISPLVVKGFNADFDGDAMQYHVPVDDDAVQEAIDRMLPSRSLISPSDFKTPVHGPSQEYVGGLYEATAGKSKKRPRTFATKKDAKAAWQRGEIDVNDPVVILER